MKNGTNRRFYTGNYRDDARNAEHLGVQKFWILGYFMPAGPRRTDKLEVKLWEFEPGPTGHHPKTSSVLECTLILEGRVSGQIDGEAVELVADEYFVVPPGVPNDVPQIAHVKSSGLTIKAPSVPGSKMVVPQPAEQDSPHQRATVSQCFNCYIGIDYSGAQTPISSLPGLRVYVADRTTAPVEFTPPPGPRKYWTRRGIAEWLVARLREDQPALVGIDHAFSFPLKYFQAHNLPLDWPAFLDDFQQHWPTDDDHVYVDFIRKGVHGNAAARSGDSRWRRLTELRTRAKSVFQFDVQGSVAKSTHAGLPWLRYMRTNTSGHVHFWPFEGWDVPVGQSAVVEVYPALWAGDFASDGRTQHQHDAYSVVAWMRRADQNGSLTKFLHPALDSADRAIAEIEGWILGVT